MIINMYHVISHYRMVFHHPKFLIHIFHGRFGPETSPGVGLPGEVLHSRDAC